MCDSDTDSCFVGYFPSGQGSGGYWSALASLVRAPPDVVALLVRSRHVVLADFITFGSLLTAEDSMHRNSRLP